MDRVTDMLNKKGDRQNGINMVDLMMWLVIAAMLLAAALQGIGYYQQGAYVYQMKEATDVAASRIMALASEDGSVDAADADAIVEEVNAATPNDEIFFTVETVNVTAAGETGNPDTEFSLMSVTTATTLGSGETFYIRAAHEGVSKSDAVYYFKDIASKKAGLHLVPKGTNGSMSGGTVTTPTGSPTATVSPTTSPAPTPTPTPTPTATTPPDDVNATGMTIVKSVSLSSASWDNRTVFSKTSQTSQFGFNLQEVSTVAQGANYKVEFSGGENIGLNATNTTLKPASGAVMFWYANIVPGAEGYKTGIGYLTAKVTNLTDGSISSKTWTITVTDNPGIVQSPSLGNASWSDRTAFSKTSPSSQFGFMINGAQAADYTVVFSGGENIGMATTQPVLQVVNSWYSNTVPAAEGYKTGVGTITATATHKGTGTVWTKSWKITVTDNPGIVQSPSLQVASWSDRTAYSKTSPSSQFGFMINGAQASDYTVVFSGGENIGMAATQPVLQVVNSWYSNTVPAAEGYKTGTGTITATATHKGTGTVWTKSWNLTVLENPGPVQSPSLQVASWSNRTVAVGATSAQFGFMINGAQASDYTVVYSGGGNIGAATTQPSLQVVNSWYSNVPAVSGGFTAGTGTITATATHKGTGHVFTKTWTLTVQ